jgi:uncharacterized protein (TIGR02996 family)
MFAVDVEGMPRRVFDGSRIDIGRSTRCDLVLPSPEVSRRHAGITQTAHDFVIEDADSAHGTWVDGARISRARITHANRIRIGPFTLTIQPQVVEDPTEARLLAAIASQQDAASRLVYADWLEQRGEQARAEFLRLQEQLAARSPDPRQLDRGTVAKTERLRALAASIEIGWRYRVARPAVEGCDARFSFRCPREWAAMTETPRPDVRHCSACDKHVYYCATMQQAQNHAESGHCVVIDVIPKRRPHDLEPPVQMGGMIAPPEWPE